MMIDQHTVGREVLSRRSTGWKIQYVLQIPVPNDVPYVDGAEAWAVCIMKQYSELGDEPEWLKGCDEETHQLYYREQGELAMTSSRVETDLVIAAQGHLTVVPCKPASAEQLGTLNAYSIVFQINFPASLSVGGS